MAQVGGEELEYIFRRQIDAFAAKDVGRLMRCYTKDAVLQDMANPEHVFVGPVEICGFLVAYFGSLDDPTVEITSIASGDGVVVGELEVVARYREGPGAPTTAAAGSVALLGGRHDPRRPHRTRALLLGQR